jgi:hypothetical protein
MVAMAATAVAMAVTAVATAVTAVATAVTAVATAVTAVATAVRSRRRSCCGEAAWGGLGGARAPSQLSRSCFLVLDMWYVRPDVELRSNY